jgi:hypothetical protein
VEALYPTGGRLFGDLDVLVDDAESAFDALLAAGFERTPGAMDHPHHLSPLSWPGNPVRCELHLRPNWPRHLQPPPTAELFADAVPSRLPIPRLEAPSPAHHTLLVAAHNWRDMPLRSVRDLLDILLLARTTEVAEIERVARRWEVFGIWRTTYRTASWLLEDGRQPLATRLWARSLVAPPREMTILETHLRRWVAPFWMLPPAPAALAAVRDIGVDAQPVGDESWGAKLRRVGWVATHPRRTYSERAVPNPNDDAGSRRTGLG